MTSVAAKGAGTKSGPVSSRVVDGLADDASIVARIAAVMADCRMIEKSAVNEQQGYSFAPEGEMVDMLRPLMARAGIVLVADLESVERYEVKFRNSAGTGCTVHLRYTLVAPNDSTPGVSWQGDATDNADKALPKALTAAKKSFLVHTFLLSTGIDPDAGGELSTGSPPAPRAAPPAPDRPASPAQVRRAFAIAANGDPVIPQDHVRLLGHLISRSHEDRVGRSIHDLTMSEMRRVFDALDDMRRPERAPVWAERLGKMAALLDRERNGPGSTTPAPEDPPPDQPFEVTYREAIERAAAVEPEPEVAAETDDDIPF
jgi:hypothetical protein